METLAATRSRARLVYLGITALHGAIRGWPHVHYCAWGWEGHRKSRSSGPSQLHSELPGTLPDKKKPRAAGSEPPNDLKAEGFSPAGRASQTRDTLGRERLGFGLYFFRVLQKHPEAGGGVNLKANQ